MASYLGDAGGITVGAEAVAYGTAAATFVPQHPVSATLGTRVQRIAPTHLGVQANSLAKFATSYSDGELVVLHNASRAVMGPIYTQLGKLTTATYAFGTGVTPDAVSMSAKVDHGGLLMQYLGLVVNSIRWDFSMGEATKVTVGVIGRKGTKESFAAITQPAESGIHMPSDIGTVTVGGVAMCLLSGSITVSRPLTGSDRVCLGGSTIKQPQQTGRWSVTGSFNCEVSADTGNNTVGELDDYLAGTALGDIVLDDWTLGTCYMVGDPPALGSGLATFPMNVEALSLALVTTA